MTSILWGKIVYCVPIISTVNIVSLREKHRFLKWYKFTLWHYFKQRQILGKQTKQLSIPWGIVKRTRLLGYESKDFSGACSRYMIKANSQNCFWCQQKQISGLIKIQLHDQLAFVPARIPVFAAIWTSGAQLFCIYLFSFEKMRSVSVYWRWYNEEPDKK